MARYYLITEHFGDELQQKWLMIANDQEEALRLCCCPQFKTPKGAKNWRFIDDGLGGGAIIDPADETHCMRADPRSEEDFMDPSSMDEGKL